MTTHIITNLLAAIAWGLVFLYLCQPPSFWGYIVLFMIGLHGGVISSIITRRIIGNGNENS